MTATIANNPSEDYVLQDAANYRDSSIAILVGIVVAGIAAGHSFRSTLKRYATKNGQRRKAINESESEPPN